MTNPYALLGVAGNASTADIKRAYRKLAKEFHPDLNPGNPAAARRFKDVTAAYDTLSDPEKRRRWDVESAGRSPFGRQTGDDALSEFLNRASRFSRPPPPPRPQRAGEDTRYAVTLNFLEAALGTRKRVELADGRAVDLAIPPATENGQTLRLKGQGTHGTNGGPAGDAFVEIKVEPHPQLARIGSDIHMTLAVTVAEAILGAAVTVPTLTGPVTLKIPRGSNTDTVLRLKERGLPAQSTQPAGDQLVTLKVVLPPPSDATFLAFVDHWGKAANYPVR
jgi:DnaJ-class molecular chaperone